MPRILAFISTLVSAFLALLTGIVGLPNGQGAPYSPEVAVLTATLVAIIWYTAFTYEALEESRERDQRELARSRGSLATALLSELRWLYSALEEFARGGALHGEVRTPVLDTALKKVTLFAPETTDRLAHTVTGVRRLRETVESGPGATDVRRLMATSVCVLVADLVPALIGEGGKLPRHLSQESFAASEIPNVLQANPFVALTDIVLPTGLSRGG